MTGRTVALIAFAFLIWAGPALSVHAQDAYTAMVAAPGMTNGGLVPFNFTVTKWSSQDDIKRLGAILKEKGQRSLLDALKDLDSGRINKIGDTGNQIALAEKWQDGNETVITMISTRRMTLFEERSHSPSTKYPFAFLQVRVDANGQGKGTLVAAAAIHYDQKKGAPRLEPYGNGASPVTNVKPLTQ